MSRIPEPIGKPDGMYYLIECLSNHRSGMTVQEIVHDIQRSEKTVRRYLEDIDNNYLDIDLLKERGPDRKYRYKIEKHAAPFRPLVFNAYEILSLFFIRGFAHFKDVNFIQQNLLSVFDKIELSAKEAKARSGNNFQERVSSLFVLPKELGGRVYNDEGELDCLNKLIEAALDHRVCNISYGTGKDIRNYKIAPLHFFNYRDAIYLLTMNIDLTEEHSKKILTTLALHRVKAVRLLDERFDYPYELDLENEFKSNSFNFADEVHNIKLKFPAHTREYILEREWYPNQTSKVQKDGSLILEFESDLNLIVQGWIRGFGPDVEVLEPKELRKTIISDLKKNLKQY